MIAEATLVVVAAWRSVVKVCMPPREMSGMRAAAGFVWPVLAFQPG
jgi:hypothetical protein